MSSIKSFTKHFIIALSFLGAVGAVSCGEDDKDIAGAEYTISLDKSELLLEVGNSQRLVAAIVPSDGDNMAHVWSSENPQIATVDETGLVTAKNVGETKIVARLLANNATAACEIVVVNKIIHVQSVKLSSSKENIAIGDVLRLTATISPSTATAKDVEWSSLDSDIATVDDSGVVRGVGIGTTIIKASADNKSAQCEITVSDRTVTFSNISYEADDSSIRLKGEYETVGVEISELGVCWAQGKAPTVSDSHQSFKVKSPFVTDISNLTPETSYYVRAYAKSGDQIYYSKTSEIATLQTLVTDFKLEEAHMDISQRNGDIYTLTISTPVIDGYGGISACYGVAPNPEITDNLAPTHTSEEKCIYTLRDLKAGQDYYIRAYAIKDNRPIYYPGESKFSTIGKDIKLNAKYTGSYIGQSIWPYTLQYTLPDNDEIYNVSIKCIYGASIGKTSSNVVSSYLNVRGGSGTLYVEMKHYNSDYNGRYGTATVSFENMSTGTVYKITFGIAN